MVLQNNNYLNTFISPEKQKGQHVKFYNNCLKCGWITSFFASFFFLLMPIGVPQVTFQNPGDEDESWVDL